MLGFLGISARRTLRDRRGVSAMEFGLLAPVLFTALLATFELGNAAQQQIKLQEALRAGGQHAITYPDDGIGIRATVTNALPAGWSNVTVSTPTTSCTCWSSTGTASCSGSGNACSAGYVVERFMTLSGSATYTGSFVSPTISASYVLRYQ